ncbi:hypothetical protein L6475_06785 [Prevotella sp. E9-3]|uniref:pullulanase X25 domain-containing protein n=1 Tax=Prevotella sp. E9-3 TaxID=2913621 RepID=UPI001EDAFB39|nr:hypothetical protein [Prevotella sp. E9-3]UKK49629.1 hypothetical protein L6475_06785 [Prevotella sp. E9-3]
MKKKIFSLLVLLVTAVTGAWAADTYTVAGNNSAMFGTAWDPTNTANDMTKNDDGTYSITYTNVYLEDDVQYKVVKDHSWNEAYPDGDNHVIDIAKAGTYTLTIHFNPNTHEVYETMPGVAPTYDLKVGTNAQGSVKFYVAETEVTKAEEGATVTVAIEPNTGWSTGSIKGLWYAAGSAKAPRRVQGNIDLLKDFELEPVEGNPNAFTFVMKRANAEISVSYRKLLTHTDISFEDIAAVTYTGQALTPDVTVKDGETVLTKDTDFSVSYESNENVGTGKATIVGIGLYSGQVEKTFTINKADITPTAPTALENLAYNTQAQTLISAGQAEGGEMQYSLDGQTYATTLPQGTNAGSYTVFYKVVGDANHNDVAPAFINVAIYKAALTNVLLEQTNLVYNQQEQSPIITSVKAGELVVPATDYTVSGSATNVGTYTMTVMAKESADNFTGTATAQYSIVAADANLFNITLGTSTFTFNGTELKPTVTVKDGEATLVENTDYTLAFTNNVNVGTATVTATGIGNYSGTKTATYTIIKADITPTAPTAQTGLVYTTQPQALIAAGQAQGGEMLYSLDNETWSTNIPTGTEAKEYTVYYKVVADANHNDVAAQNFKVTIDKATLTAATLTETNFIYNQQEQTALAAIVSAGAITVPDAGYEIADNKATNVGNYTATLTGKGNFKGSVTANWSIVAANANLFNITLGTNEYTYDGTAKTPTVTVKDGEATLVENTDYTLAYTANTNAGTATVTVTGKGNYSGTKTATFTIKTADITPTAPTAKTGLVFNALPQTLISAGSAQGGEMQYSLDNVNYSTSLPSGFEAKEYTVYYKVVADANHNDVAAQSFKVTIAQAELTELILAQTTLTYNQQEQTVAVASVKAGNLPVAADSYEVSGNKGTNVDEYTVTVTGKGNFKNTATAKFTIVPAEAEAEFEITLGTTEYIYDGTAKTPAVTVKDGSAVLVEGTDYTLAYTANTNAGTATVTATGKGNYSGTQTATFTIKPATLTSVTLAQTEFQYNLFTPVAQTAGIAEVKAGNLIVPAEQYEVEGNTQTEPGTYTVTVTGKTNFQGSVTADFVIKDQVVDGEGEKTESGEEVDDIDMTVSVVDRTQQTLNIDEITGGTASGEGITVEIPATVNGWTVVSVSANAMNSMNNVTDIVMPDTEKPIEIEAGAFPGTATIHTTLAMLDDYALMASLKDNYEATKVVCTVTPANKYWTLGTGCDVIIPDGIDVYTVQVKNSAEVATEIVPEDQLKYGNERIIKANNGVLLLGTAGQTYDLVAYSGRIASGMPVATSDNKDYGQKNCLEPVIEKKHYDSGHYFVLQNNEFHSILAEGDEVKVPAGKAVLHLGNDQAGANSRVLKIDAEATGIESVELRTENGEFATATWYTLDGRKLNAKPTTKGMYILNGRKVVVK